MKRDIHIDQLAQVLASFVLAWLSKVMREGDWSQAKSDFVAVHGILINQPSLDKALILNRVISDGLLMLDVFTGGWCAAGD